MALDLLGDVVQQVDLAELGVAPADPDQHAPQPAGALAARRALAARFVHVELGQPRDRRDHVGRGVHHDHGGGAEAALHVAQRIEVHQHVVADRLRDQRHRGAARDDREQVAPAAAHAPGVLVDQLPQRDAHRLLDRARLVHVARDAVDLGARVVRSAEAREPGGAAPQDGRDDRDRLDVADRGRAAVHPDRRGERRLEARLAHLALEALQQPGLLAADVGAGAAVQVDLVVVAGAAGILADQSGGVRLVDRRLQDLRLAHVFAADVDVAGGGAHAGAGEQAALDQLVRVVAHDLPVLAGAGLALVGVDHQVDRPAVRLLGHERHLEAGREACAAAPAQARFLDLLDDPVAPLEDQVARAVPVAAPARRRKPPVVLAVEIGEDAVLVSEHRDPSPLSGCDRRCRGPAAALARFSMRAP